LLVSRSPLWARIIVTMPKMIPFIAISCLRRARQVAGPGLPCHLPCSMETAIVSSTQSIEPRLRPVQLRLL
jgi:hypothetical protein